MPIRQVSAWREQLPPPFDKPAAVIRRRASLDHVGRDTTCCKLNLLRKTKPRRRTSLHGAVEGSDRALEWLRFLRHGRDARHALLLGSVIQKLKRRTNLPCSIGSQKWSQEDEFSPLDTLLTKVSTIQSIEEPSIEEFTALASECFPRLEDARVIITEYSETHCRVSHFTLEEVLSSKHLLGSPPFIAKVRWIYVEYYKLGTFWGSDVRFLQWGTDPVLFEKSPIKLLQKRLHDLDKLAGRAPLKDEELAGYKHIGKYYRQLPGSPEFLGLRVNSASWIMEDQCQLLLDFLERNPSMSQSIQARGDNDLAYGLSYVEARRILKAEDNRKMSWDREMRQRFSEEDLHFHGSCDDHIERLEFHREHTLLTCGSPRLYEVAAARLMSKDDPLRQIPDAACLYYMLSRVSIENDEMMQDGPERALNKVFMDLKSSRDTNKSHIERLFNIQQRVIDGLDYLEENHRELVIWGIPPFGSHQVEFHPDRKPAQELRNLIMHEMDLVEKDFRTTINNWKSLKSKVDRHLDVLVQFRVLEQQELAVKQRDISVRQQNLAITEAKTSRAQSRSMMIFTAITIIFLPLSFFTSYFGMNITDISDHQHDSKFFWLVSGPISVVVIGLVFIVARYTTTSAEPDLEASIEPRARTSYFVSPFEKKLGLWKLKKS